MEKQEEITGKLAEAGRELPFTVPRHYFEDFPARMEAIMAPEAPAQSPKIPRGWSLYLKPVFGMAAAFAAVFLLVYWPAKLITNPSALSAARTSNSYDETIISLVEQVDDHTFFSLLQNGSASEKLDTEELENYLALNYSDYEIYMETKK